MSDREIVYSIQKKRIERLDQELKKAKEKAKEKIKQKLEHLNKEKGYEMKRRIGKINVTRGLLEEQPERVAEIFHIMKFAPFDIVPSERLNYFTYTGYSLEFEECIDGDIIPEYMVELHMNRSDGKGFIDGVKLLKINVDEDINKEKKKDVNEG